MNTYTLIKPTGVLSALVLLGSATLHAGIQHISAADPKGGMPKEPIPAPPPIVPPKDCDGCTEPGFYLHASALYLRSYNSDISDFEGEWDAGVRGTVGWESPSGLFAEVTAFYHDTDYVGEDGIVTGNFEFFYIDGTVGDTIHCGELCLGVSAGFRYSHFEFNEDWGGMAQNSVFDGVGPVFSLEATRALTKQLDLYGNIRQSLLFGQSDYNGYDTDTLASITEIGAGLQWNFDLAALSNAFVRAGFEGQYWHVDSASIGLLGGVFGVGALF